MADQKSKQGGKKENRRHVKSNKNGAANEKVNEEEVENVINNFEVELAWCIQELKLGIASHVESKADFKKAEEAVKFLKILESSSAPLPKKRCAMKSAFGDYRKKMEESRKKSETAWKNSKITAVESDSKSPSKFLKKCSALSSPSSALSSSTSPTQSGSSVVKNDGGSEDKENLPKTPPPAQTITPDKVKTLDSDAASQASWIGDSAPEVTNGQFMFKFDVDEQTESS